MLLSINKTNTKILSCLFQKPYFIKLLSSFQIEKGHHQIWFLARWSTSCGGKKAVEQVKYPKQAYICLIADDGFHEKILHFCEHDRAQGKNTVHIDRYQWTSSEYRNLG